MNEDIIRVDSYDFDERIQSGVTLVFFYEHLNVHSRALEPIIEETAQQYYESVRTLAVDIEQSPDIAYRYGIEAAPTVIMLCGGDELERIEGANPPSVYTDALDDILMNIS